uniref:Transposase n=1 Tax=Mesocestoides corti TaxID=53468 RepID=A0A5K3G894_MESCO
MSLIDEAQFDSYSSPLGTNRRHCQGSKFEFHRGLVVTLSADKRNSQTLQGMLHRGRYRLDTMYSHEGQRDDVS